jgi:hypothetical protein
MLLGPTLLIALRLYLQIYVEHSNRLDRLARRMPAARAPTLVPLKKPADTNRQWLDLLFVAASSNDAFCLEGRRLLLGIGAALRCGNGHRQPHHVAIQQDFQEV